MKKTSWYLYGAIAALVAGFTFFLLQRNWLIIYFAFGDSQESRELVATKKSSSCRRTINFCFWKDDRLQNEPTVLIWFQAEADNVRHIINTWLAFLYEERLVDRRINLETVALSEFKQRVYLSFDQAPFGREWAIQKKWFFLEALCRTISGTGTSIKEIVFLVNQQPMVDDHLALSQPWPIDGFMGL